MAIEFRVYGSAEAVGKETWNRLAADAGPMMEWEYFHALEGSGSVSPQQGYRGTHLVVHRDGEPIALAPLYERDRAWAEFGDGGLVEFLTQLSGLPYSRGLVGNIPFTPVPCYQWLHGPQGDPALMGRLLLDGLEALCMEKGLSTCRIHFVSHQSQELHQLLRQSGYLALKTDYALWFNARYSDFDDYLKSLKSNRRTKIRRELREIRNQGIVVRMISGEEGLEGCYDTIYQLYRRTWYKYMANALEPFLNESFFRLLARDFMHRSTFCTASRDSRTLAMALFYEKGDRLYGRYWGSFEKIPFLHFATCYYHPIEYAIHRGIAVLDPGFGGEHKLLRGCEVLPAVHYIKFFGERERRTAFSILRRLRDRQAML